jgi:hypothetical protein
MPTKESRSLQILLQISGVSGVRPDEALGEEASVHYLVHVVLDYERD